MADGEPLEAIWRLLHLADAYGLAELVVEEDGLKVVIRAGQPAVTAAVPPPAVDILLPTAEPAGDAARFHAILSPMTGVFYRSPSPDTPPFVEAGDLVEEGQAVGLIEAMKVFSEIPADCTGRVVETLVASGTLVSQGDPLMLLDPAT